MDPPIRQVHLPPQQGIRRGGGAWGSPRTWAAMVGTGQQRPAGELRGAAAAEEKRRGRKIKGKRERSVDSITRTAAD